jgi:hypothetical protein
MVGLVRWIATSSALMNQQRASGVALRDSLIWRRVYAPDELEEPKDIRRCIHEWGEARLLTAVSTVSMNYADNFDYAREPRTH